MSSWALLPALYLHPKIRLTHTHTHAKEEDMVGVTFALDVEKGRTQKETDRWF